jgi:hypothetical protein
MTAGVQLKNKSGRHSQGAWRQDELIGGKTASRKVTLTLTLNSLSTKHALGVS